MKIEDRLFDPLISVIIPCYNQGVYLARAIESVLEQSYTNVEIVVVNDGSIDNTFEVAANYTGIVYVHQDNRGLSAARNTGVKYSKGKMFVFLDADDWLLPNALLNNVMCFNDYADIAFVSGGHIMVSEPSGVVEEKIAYVDENHYQHFLIGNYIAMHGAVMYQRWVFDVFQFDTKLQAFEDYDMYLKVSRRYKIYHHQKLIAAYRIHQNNMSGNFPLMIKSALLVLQFQRPLLRSKAEFTCYKFGLKYWSDYYSGAQYRNFCLQPWSAIKKKYLERKMLLKYGKPLYIKLIIKKILYGG